MAAVISGEGLGLYTGSLNTLGRSFGRHPQVGQHGDSVYVNVHTGNLVVRNRDEFIRSQGPDLSLIRTYNSLGLNNDDNGDNWRLNIRQRLELIAAASTAGSIIRKTSGDGSVTEFHYDTGLGYYISTDGDGAHDEIRYLSATNEWEWSNGSSDIREGYDAAGRLLWLRDADGHQRSFTYTGDLVTQITDSSGQTVDLVYSGNNLSQISTSSNAVIQSRVSYSYQNNRLHQVTVDLSPQDNSTADGDIFVTTYGYDTQGRVNSISNTDGSALTITYRTDGKVKTLTDGEGQTTTYTYHAQSTDVSNALGQITTYHHDTRGRLSRVDSSALNSSGTRLTTQYSYDANDNLVRVLDANGHATSYEYDARGNLIRQRDAAGNTVEYSYTSINQGANQLQSKTVYLQADPDLAADHSTDGVLQAVEPQTEWYVYDNENHLRFTVSAEGRVQEYRYAVSGERIAALSYTATHFTASETAPTEVELNNWVAAQDLTQLQRTDYQYDFRGQLSRTTTFSATQADGAGQLGTESHTYFIYDQRGQLLKTVDSRGSAPLAGAHQANNFETAFAYDGLGRLLSRTDALGQVSSTLYNDAGQSVSSTQANGLINTVVYDNNGRTVSISELDPADLATPLSQSNRVYDAEGRLRATQDANGAIEHILYDAAGRAVASISATGTFSENLYDANGNVIETIEYSSTVDSVLLSQLVVLNAQGVLTGINEAITLTQLRPVVHADDRHNYRYYDEADRLQFTIDAEGYVVEYRYNGADELTDTIEHSTPFPGFINNDAQGAQIDIHNSDVLLSWLNGNALQGTEQINASIINEESGQAITVDVDLATNSGTVSTTRAPEQIYPSDQSASTDVRSEVGQSVTVGNTHSTHVIPPSEGYAINRSDAYNVTPQVHPITIRNGSTFNTHVSVSGSTYTVSNVPYSSGTGMGTNHWMVRLFKNTGSGWAQLQSTMTTTQPGTQSFESLTAGDYYVETQEYYAQMTGPGSPTIMPNSTSTPKHFRVGQAVGTVVGLPTLGASKVDFYVRDGSRTGQAYSWVHSDSTPPYNIRLQVEQNNQWLDFLAVYKDSQNLTFKMAAGTIYSSAGNVTDTTMTVHHMERTSGTLLYGALTVAETGSLGDELGSTLKYVDARVYDVHTNQLVSTARTYPSVVAAATTDDGKLNLSIGTPLPDGEYRIELDKHYKNDTVSTITLDNYYQVGNIVNHIQTLSWPASTQSLDHGDTATFLYRKTGDTAFTELNLSDSEVAHGSYFVHSNNEHKVQLYGLDSSQTYEYKVEYRDASGKLVKWTALNTFNSSASANNPVQFLHHEDSTTAATGGTRLLNFLSPEETQTIDYLSVRLIDDTSGAVVQDNVLTLPGVQNNGQGAINLSNNTPLADGRYRVEVTRHFKNPALTSQTDSFIHEVGLQTISTQALTVTQNGDQVTATYTGNLGTANGVVLNINTGSGAVSLNAQQLNEGPYSYKQRVTSVDNTFAEDQGRFAAYAGDTPNVSALRDFYSRTRNIAVEVTQSENISFRDPQMPVGYSYVTQAENLSSTIKTSTVALVTNTTTENSTNVLSGNRMDISVINTYTGRTNATGQTVWKYISIHRQSDGAQVYSDPVPDLRPRSTQNGVGPLLRHAEPLNYFSLPTLPPGAYRLQINTVVVSRTYTYSEYIDNGNVNTGQLVTYTEEYARGTQTHSVNFEMHRVKSATVSWPQATQPTGTTTLFRYRPVGATAYLAPSALNTSGGNWVASVNVNSPGRYEYLIEYKDASGGVVKSSTGYFHVVREGDRTSHDTGTMRETVPVMVAVNGSAIISDALTAEGAVIDHVRAWVYDAETDEMVSLDAHGNPSVVRTDVLTGESLGAIKLMEQGYLSSGRYRVKLNVFYTNGDITVPQFHIEVGQQQEAQAATTLRWDATNRPKNTDVYFRYKSVAEHEFDPRNMWIRASASQSVQGEFYVRFPQMTADGQLLDTLPEGQYDYMVVYVDRDNGKEVESALGQFDVSYINGGPDQSSTHQLNFVRDLDGRQSRTFYDADGRQTGTLDALGYLTELRYNAAGQLVETIRYATETNALLWDQGSLEQLRPAASAEDLHEYIKYNGRGQQVLSINAEGYVLENRYDEAGNTIEVIRYASPSTAVDVANSTIAAIRPLASANDRKTVNSYDALNQLVRVSEQVGSVVVSVTEYEYNSVGDLLRTTQAVGNVDERSSLLRYDLQGRLIAALNGEGGQALNALLASNPLATQTQIDAVWDQYAIEYQYDAAGQRTQVLDQHDQSTRFYYDADGNIRYQINAAGEIEETIYNNFGQLSHIIQYHNRLDAVQLASLAGGSLSASVRTLLNGLRDPENDSVVEQDYDLRGLVIANRDALGQETRYQYNAFGELRFERHTISGGVNHGREHRVEHIYDARGQRTNIISGQNGDDLSLGYEYDAFGRVTASYRYDSAQNLFDHIVNRYDGLGQLTEALEIIHNATPIARSINGFSYDAFGRVLTQSDAAGGVTQYHYDDVNRTVTVTTPENIVTSSTHNALGETVSVTDGNGETTQFEYDKNGQLTRSTDGEGNITTSEYDNAGRLIVSTDANNTRVEFRYDAVNRVIERIVDPSGLALSSQTEYDAQGRVIKTTDPDGIVTESHYDLNGQVVAIIVDPHDPASGREHVALGTYYQYDSQGNQLLVSVGTQPGIRDGVDELSNPIQTYEKALNSTRYDYDIHGRLIRETIDPTILWTDSAGNGREESGLNISTEYHYNARGDLAAQTNARGFTTRYIYDDSGRLLYTIAEQDNDRGLVTQNHYDANGRVIAVEQYANTVDLFNADKALDAADVESLLTGISTVDNRLQQQVYDADGRLIYTISPSGLVNKNIYDSNNNVIQTIAYSESIAAADYASIAQVEAALVLAADSAAEQQAWSVYDANGLALFNIDSLGYVTANTYDGNGNLLRSVQYAQAIDTAVLNDTIDNRSQLESLLAAHPDNRVTRFTYDAASRLVYTLDAAGYISENRYDAAGRVEAVINYASRYTIAAATPSISDILAVLPAQPSAADRITQTVYDAAGRAIATQDAEGGVEYHIYDQAGNRVAWTNAKGYTWHYAYDAANRMIETRTPEVAVSRLNAVMWQQDFAIDINGLTASADATTLNAAVLDDGRLALYTREHSSDSEPSISSDRVYSFDERMVFRAEISTAGSAVNRHAFYGIQNSGSTSDGSYRQHGVLFQGDTAYVRYYNGSWQTEVLGTLKDNTAYIVEVVTHEQGTTVYLLEQGQSTSDGLTHELTLSGWNTAQAMLSTKAGVGAAGGVVYIDKLQELLPRDRTLMNESATLSAHSVTESIITRFEYNAMGNVTQRIEAAGTTDQRITYYNYDAMNRQVTTTHPEVGVYEYTDADINYVSGRQETLQALSTKTYFDVFGNAVLATDTAGNRSYKVYDANNRLLYDIDANGHVTENRYDAFGNVLELVRYAQAITLPTAAIDPLNPGLSADAVALQLNTADANNRSLLTEYDLLNRAIKTEQSAVTVVDAITSTGGATLSNAAPTTQNSYNAFGQLTKQSVLADGNRWLDTYLYYDHNGNKTGQLDAEGYVTRWEYDEAGNITRHVEYANAIDPQAVGVNVNDINSVMAAVQPSILNLADSNTLYMASGQDREVRFVYDRLNRLLAETQVGVLLSDASVTGEGTNQYSAGFSHSITNLTTAYEYDAVGNVTAVTDVQGNITYQFYDAMGRLTGETAVSRKQQQVSITTHTTVTVENAGTADVALRWARPPVPGLVATLQLRAVGSTSWHTVTVVEGESHLQALVAHLPSDQYEYLISYSQLGETDVYATAGGRLNIASQTATGSVGVAYQVSNQGDTVVISGNTAGLTGIVINGVLYTATSVVNDRHTFDLSSLARGNYTFITQGVAEAVSGQVQKITGALGGEFAIQTTDVDIQYEVTEQAYYTVTRVNKEGKPKDGYWGENEVRITVPSLTHLGTAHLQYEVTLDFSNAYGERKERVMTGTVSGQSIIINIASHSPHEGMRYHGRLEDIVSIKLWRGDANTVAYTEQPNFIELFNSNIRLQSPAFTIEAHYAKRDLVLSSTGGVNSQQLEFINLPSDAQTAVFRYRNEGGAWIEKALNKVGPGYFTLNHRDIPPGQYEYEVRINGSNTAVASGQGLYIGNGIDGYHSVSAPDVSNSNGEAIITPLTSYKRDVFGNAVQTTVHANSAQFNADGTVNVVEDSARDQNVYVQFDTHGNMTALQDGEGSNHFYSYDKQGNRAKEWQWVSVRDDAAVTGNRLFSGTVYRYDAVGQQLETINIGETVNINAGQGIHDRQYTQISTQAEYNAFGEVTRRGTNNGWQEYFDYDNTGRLWRSNAENGVDKIYLYDVQGNQRQRISSQGRDLSATAYDYTALATTAGLSTDVMKTSYFYDDLGRMLRQLQPGRLQGSVSYLPQHDFEQDRWGNVTRHTNANGLINEFRYDWRNQQIRQAILADVNPTQHSYYDALGNLIGSTDANQNKRVNEYDAAGQLIRQLAGDGGIQRFNYDVLGNQVEQIKYLGAESSTPFATLREYDLAGRLLRELSPNGGEMLYQYDEADNRTQMQQLVKIDSNGHRHYETTLYTYDNRGNLIAEKRNALIEVYDNNRQLISSTINPYPITHHFGYDVHGNKVFEQHNTALNAAVTASWHYDDFNRLQTRTDFGGGAYSYSYNEAGQLLQESVSRGTDSSSKQYSYYDDGSLQSVSRGTVTDSYEYNAGGQVINEYADSSVDGRLYHNHYDYNALGRLSRFTGNSDSLVFNHSSLYGGTTANGRGYWLDINYEYDAMGNRTHVHGSEGMRPAYSYWEQTQSGGIEHSGPAQHGLTAIDQWYSYDAENRVLISRGKNVGNTVIVDQHAEDSIAYSYDKGGNRIQALYYRGGQAVNENHYYDAVGNVVTTTENGQYTSERSYDLLGRVTQFTAYRSPGTKSEIHHSTYNINGLLDTRHIYDVDGGGNQGGLKVEQLYNHSNSYDMNGNLKYYTMRLIGEGAGLYNYTYTHEYFDSAVTASTTVSHGSTTTHQYDAFGNVLSVSNSSSEQAGQNRNFTLNAAGQVVHKQQGQGNDAQHQFYYYHEGRTIGTGGQLETDFDYTAVPLSSAGGVAQGPSNHVVRAGDSLRSIALAVYGDAQLWYLIADANGIGSDADLVAGQTLTIPGQVNSLRNSTSAYRPFGAANIIGDTTPGLPVGSIPAPVIYDIKQDKSNPFIQILAMVVSIVVAIYAPQLAPQLKGIGAAIFGAAVGNVAGQAILVAGGEQKGFDWASFASDIVTAGMGGGAAGNTAGGATKSTTDKIFGAMKNAAIKNIFNQGINIVAGKQEKFSWSSLAAAVVVAPVAQKLGQGIDETNGFDKFGQRLVNNLITNTLSQGIRIMVDGGGKMDWGSVAVNAFGQALGDSIVGQMTRNDTIEQMQAANAFYRENNVGIELDSKDPEQIQTFYENRRYWNQAEGLNDSELNALAGVSVQTAHQQQKSNSRTMTAKGARRLDQVLNEYDRNLSLNGDSAAVIVNPLLKGDALSAPILLAQKGNQLPAEVAAAAMAKNKDTRNGPEDFINQELVDLIHDFDELNRNGPECACVNTARLVLSLLTGNYVGARGQRPGETTGGTVFHVVDFIRSRYPGMLGETIEIPVLDNNGRDLRNTSGHKVGDLSKNILDVVRESTGDMPGISVFLLGHANGYHVATLFFDNSDPENPRFDHIDQVRLLRNSTGKEIDDLMRTYSQAEYRVGNDPTISLWRVQNFQQHSPAYYPRAREFSRIFTENYFRNKANETVLKNVMQDFFIKGDIDAEFFKNMPVQKSIFESNGTYQTDLFNQLDEQLRPRTNERVINIQNQNFERSIERQTDEVNEALERRIRERMNR